MDQQEEKARCFCFLIYATQTIIALFARLKRDIISEGVFKVYMLLFAPHFGVKHFFTSYVLVMLALISLLQYVGYSILRYCETRLRRYGETRSRKFLKILIKSFVPAIALIASHACEKDLPSYFFFVAFGFSTLGFYLGITFHLGITVPDDTLEVFFTAMLTMVPLSVPIPEWLPSVFPLRWYHWQLLCSIGFVVYVAVLFFKVIVIETEHDELAPQHNIESNNNLDHPLGDVTFLEMQDPFSSDEDC